MYPAFLWLLASALLGAGGPPASAAEPPKRIEAARLDHAVHLDGVLSEAAWQRPGSDAFMQRYPKVGASPSERTEVWVAYDDEALYVAARCLDGRPDDISRNIGRRDADVDADWFAVSLDAHRDRRTGFYFRVTPGGAIQDGTLYDEAHVDLSWDGIWEHGTAIDTSGWSVEVRIPFAQLRYGAGEGDVWGVNFARRIHRKNEVVDFTAPRSARAPYFADLAGLQDIGRLPRVELLPYGVVHGQTYESDGENPFFPGQNVGTRLGGDAKVHLTPGLTLDATLNPDFAQVEVDPAVVNLTAYETFFEEKRPFFLENQRLFDFGAGHQPIFFHSRRIGRAPRGEPVHQGYRDVPTETDITGATKLSGKLGRWSVGGLSALTARTFARVDSAGVRFRDEVEPRTFYGVLRAVREGEEGRHGLGVFASGVRRDPDAVRLRRLMNDDAFVVGLDGWSRLGRRRWWLVEGWASLSRLTGTPAQIVRVQRAAQRYFQRPDARHLRLDSTRATLGGGAGYLRVRRQGGRIKLDVSLSALSPGFDLNDLGYLRHADRLSGEATLTYGWYQPHGGFHRKRVGLTLGRTYDFGAQLLSTSVTAFVWGQLRNAWGGSLSLSYLPEGRDVTTTRGGAAMVAPRGWSGNLQIVSDRRKAVTLSLSGRGSLDDGGNRSYDVGGGLAWQALPGLTLSVTPWWTDATWQAGYITQRRSPFATETYGVRTIFATLRQRYLSTDLRVDWTLSPALSLQTYVQPYVSVVRYGEYKELARADSYDFLTYGDGASTIAPVDDSGGYRIDPDGDAGPARPFVLYESDFDFASLRSTMVLRWEYRRGSTLFFVWTQDRYRYRDFWQRPAGGLLSAAPYNEFMVKLTFWLGT